jgi:threonine aldolase
MNFRGGTDMNQALIDLRSDTVTWPTPAMRKAMAEAVVGDDVYGDDPTVNALEQEAARIMGKEAALFVVSGTMGNQVALMAQVERGDEVVLSDRSHIVLHEAGGAAILSGAQLRCLPVRDGQMDLGQIEQAIRKNPSDIHSPRTALISLENADSDGIVLDPNYLRKVRERADHYHIRVHLDGARIFNAEAAGSLMASEIASYADTVQICLSKGLCAPVGSLLLGPRETIRLARRKRKILGGGMRQAGILAAAGLIALRDQRKRLVEDHETARFLANRLSEYPEWFKVIRKPQINMVFIRLTGYPVDPGNLEQRLSERKIVINGPEEGVLRLVTHQGVTKAHLEHAVQVLVELGNDPTSM